METHFSWIKGTTTEERNRVRLPESGLECPKLNTNENICLTEWTSSQKSARFVTAIVRHVSINLEWNKPKMKEDRVINKQAQYVIIEAEDN